MAEKGSQALLAPPVFPGESDSDAGIFWYGQQKTVLRMQDGLLLLSDIHQYLLATILMPGPMVVAMEMLFKYWPLTVDGFPSER